jgi:apoptosis-inducing factor 3
VGGPYREVPFFWSQHHDVSFSYVGHAASWDHIESRGSLEARDYAAFYLRGGRVLAALLLGRDQLGLRVEAALASGDESALGALMAEG